MKISLLFSTLILALTGILVWRGHQRLVAVKHVHETLVREAAALGVSENGAHSRPGSRAPRPDKEAEAKQFSAEFIAFAREIDRSKKDGNREPDKEAIKRAIALTDRMLVLDVAQLKTIISELHSAPGLKDETKQELISFSLLTLSSENPRAALNLFTESSDLLGENKEGLKHIAHTALLSWAREDPAGAIAWFRGNKDEQGDDQMRANLLRGVAASDPALAFRLLGEEEESKRAAGVENILRAGGTPEQRLALLGALRSYTATLPAGSSRENATLELDDLVFGGYREGGYEEISTWIKSAALTAKELETATRNIEYAVKHDDAGRWIEWLSTVDLPERAVKERAYNLAGHWTENDYEAAGKWLATAPDGPGKQAAVRAYVEKVHPYDREVALQWALTIPPGEERVKALKEIHGSMPKKTSEQKAAAKAFAKEHLTHP